MLPEPPPAESPAHWLRYATADLAIARLPLPPGGLWEVHCFYAQQAVEKCIKAVLVQHRVEFPFTHNLQRLIDLLPAQIARLRDLVTAAELTAYAVASRYPGDEAY